MARLLEYIDCYPLSDCPYKNTWKRHTLDRIVLAVELSKCYSETRRVRECSKKLWKAYRRLEDYAKCVMLINTQEKLAYGKLIEITIYIKYESEKKNWNRHIELRILFPKPLDYDCFDALGVGVDYWVKRAIEFIEAYGDVGLAMYIENVYEYGEADFTKYGCRELIKDCGFGQWCNFVTRFPLSDYSIKSYDVVGVEIYDYRGYVWRFGVKC